MTIVHNGITASPITVDLSTGAAGFFELGTFFFSGAPASSFASRKEPSWEIYEPTPLGSRRFRNLFELVFDPFEPFAIPQTTPVYYSQSRQWLVIGLVWHHLNEDTAFDRLDYSTIITPFITIQWPGNVQRYG